MKTERLPFCLVLTVAVILLVGSVAPTGQSISRSPGVTVMTLVKGGPIHGANGVYFGPDGNLYIASVYGNEIIKMDPDSGRILDRIGRERGVRTPDDLVFGPDGSLYWTAIIYGMVGKLAPDGTQSTIATGLPGANPITFSADGRLFVALDFFGVPGLYELDPNGVQPPKLILGTWDIYNLNGFDFGPDGWLYGPIYGQKVVKIDVNAASPAPVDVITGIAPSAVKFDSQGRLYTTDNSTGDVLRYDFGRWQEKQVLATLPFGMDNLAIDESNHVFVSGDGIAKLLPNGNHVLISPGGMMFPSGVAVLPRPGGGESVFVADVFSLHEFDGRTGKERSVQGAGVESTGLVSNLFSIASDGNHLIAASSFSGVVQVWDPSTAQVLEAHPDPLWPVNAIRYMGDLVVTEMVSGQVVRWTSGGPVTLAQLYGPVGLAANGSDLWATDYSLGMVFWIGPSGPVPIAADLAGPEGIAYYPLDGSLLVVESNAGRLTKIDPWTGARTVLVEGLQLGYHLLPEFMATSDTMIDGVAVGPSGAIYVTGNKASVLYRIEIRR